MKAPAGWRRFADVNLEPLFGRELTDTEVVRIKAHLQEWFPKGTPAATQTGLLDDGTKLVVFKPRAMEIIEQVLEQGADRDG